jgi:hypothetical protein
LLILLFSSGPPLGKPVHLIENLPVATGPTTAGIAPAAAVEAAAEISSAIESATQVSTPAGADRRHPSPALEDAKTNQEPQYDKAWND